MNFSTTTCDFNRDASSTLTGFVCTSTPAYDFTPGEAIISFFLFIIILGGFLTFIIHEFIGIRIKKIK